MLPLPPALRNKNPIRESMGKPYSHLSTKRGYNRTLCASLPQRRHKWLIACVVVRVMNPEMRIFSTRWDVAELAQSAGNLRSSALNLTSMLPAAKTCRSVLTANCLFPGRHSTSTSKSAQKCCRAIAIAATGAAVDAVAVTTVDKDLRTVPL